MAYRLPPLEAFQCVPDACARLRVCADPGNMALTPDGKKLYVANGRSNSVSVIDTATLKVTKEIPVGELPWGVTIP